MKQIHALRGIATVALSTAIVVGVAACSSSTSGHSSNSTGISSKQDGEEQAADLTIKEPWVKAAPSEMSAAFGLLVNSSDKDIRVVSSTCDASPVMELHETVESAEGQMVMREKEGGFLIPANSEYVLQPGANHLMLMDIIDPILAGNTVSFALELEDGSVFEFDAPAKDYEGANETYVDE